MTSPQAREGQGKRSQMNTYVITSTGAIMGRTTVKATNIHTAIKCAYYPYKPGVTQALIIKRGEKVTIQVERI